MPKPVTLNDVAREADRFVLGREADLAGLRLIGESAHLTDSEFEKIALDYESQADLLDQLKGYLAAGIAGAASLRKVEGAQP